MIVSGDGASVVSGGGAALLHCIPSIDEIDTSDLLREEIVGIEIVREAIKAPFMQILINAGERDLAVIYAERILSTGGRCGYDAYKLEFVDDMLEAGIIDPAKVVRAALEHAASASGTLLTTEVSIYQSEKL